MRNKFWYLVKNGFKKKTGTKSFRVVNIIILIAIVALSNLDTIIKKFGGDFDQKNTIYVKTDEVSYSAFSSYLDAYLKSSNIENYEYKIDIRDEEEIKKDLVENEEDILVKITNENHVINSEIVSYKSVDALTYQLVATALQESKQTIFVNSSNLTEEEKMTLLSPIDITRTYLSDEVDDLEGAKETYGALLIPLFIIPFFMLVVLLIQFVGADINEEKTTRGMEIIISSVSPETHLFSKIISGTLFVLLQGILLIGYIGIGMLIKTVLVDSVGNTGMVTEFLTSMGDVVKSYGVLDNIIPALIIIGLLFVVSFITYALFAAILASMTTSIEDYQQVQIPIMILCVIGYYLAIMASTMDGSILIKTLSYVPFISAMLSPVLFFLGQTTLIDLLVALGCNLVILFLLFKFGVRVYKNGILNYSSKDLFKKMFKSMKKE